MKHKMYNIRNINKNTIYEQNNQEKVRSLQDLSRPQTASQNQFSQFLSMFQSFLEKAENKQQKQSKFLYQVQARDRQVIVSLPIITNNKICWPDLKAWISKVIKTVCSTAFHYFFKKEMNYEQTKIFCSQNIFKNIVVLSQQYSLSAEQIQVIDNHIKNSVLSYLGTKYPLTDSVEINKKLEQIVQQVDNSESISYNYFNNSKVVFEYRQSGNYNDLIMEVVNDLMGIINKEVVPQKSNFQDFKEFVQSIFEKVGDEDWMRKQQKDQIKLGKQQSEVELHQIIKEQQITKQDAERTRRRDEEREKYKNKVKQYTHYLIGRKIPQNTATFTESQIRNKKIAIKSPTILRILTKWCEELEQKYKNNYFSNRSESVKVQKGQNINSILAWMRRQIDEDLDRQSKQINSQMKDLLKNNYEMQSNILQNQLLTKGNQQVEQIEKVCGKFSTKVVKTLHTYIITYLNNLIHGLLKVSKKIYDQYALNTYSYWPSPPNLLTFKIGDLMRTKCSSKQKQIIKLYNQLQRISKQNPQKLKIIRIKNRLRSGTNDILMNIRFNNLITCEIQLAIKSKVSDFIQCSNLFHHYLYQLQRSIFGPLTQLCSIWNSLDQRTNIYAQLVENQSFNQINEHSCAKLKNKFEMNSINHPFICSSCSRTYFDSNYIKNHSKCSLCSFSICANCRINKYTEEQLKNEFILQPQLLKVCKSKIRIEEQIPQFGICISTEAKEAKSQIFTLVTYQKSKYLLGKQGDEQIYEICQINNKKKLKKFRKKYIIFAMEQNEGFKPIDEKEARNKYIIPQLMKQNFKKQKQSLNLMQLQLTTEQCRSILSVGHKSQKQKVKNIFLVDNNIQELPFNPNQFPHLQWLTLSRNTNLSFNGFAQLKNLKILVMSGCNLQAIPPQLYDCHSIEHLSLPKNEIKSFDSRITNLKRLISFELNENQVQKIPLCIFQCKSLKILKLQNNLLTQIPDNIVNLINLEVLVYSSNKLTSITEKIGELQELKEINLFFNPELRHLPSSIQKLTKLQVFDIGSTQIEDIPIPSKGWMNLKSLKVNDSKIKKLTPAHLNSNKLSLLLLNSNPQLQLPIIQHSNIQTCEATLMQWKQLPSCIFKMAQLQYLKLSFNKLSSHISFKCFTHLQYIILNDCQFTKVPDFGGCRKLKHIDLSGNQIQQIPNQCMNYLQSLQKFICANNRLTTLCQSMIRLKMLTRLDIKDNRMTQLFDNKTESKIIRQNIGWPNLKYVDLSTNKLKQIPFILCNSPKIAELFLFDNQLMSIPPQIKNITCLREISLSSNQIQSIPLQFYQLKNLVIAHLINNNITKIIGNLQNLKNLTSFLISQQKIQEIECLQWILTAKGIDFDGLYKRAYKIKYGVDLQENNEPRIQLNEPTGWDLGQFNQEQTL